MTTRRRPLRPPLTPARQIEPGSSLLNVNFDYLKIFNRTRGPTGGQVWTLIRKWPIDIADANTIPSAFESIGNEMLVQFVTGGFSSSPDVYQGFKARWGHPCSHAPRISRRAPQPPPAR